MTTFIGILRQMGKARYSYKSRAEAIRQGKQIQLFDKVSSLFPYLCHIKKKAFDEPLSVQSRK